MSNANLKTLTQTEEGRDHGQTTVGGVLDEGEGEGEEGKEKDLGQF